MRSVQFMMVVLVAFLTTSLAKAQCDLVLADTNPGVAGRMNTWCVSGAVEGDIIVFVFGLEPGEFYIEHCDVTLGLAAPVPFAFAIADANGEACARRMVPRPVAGQTVLFQAIAAMTCCASNVTETTF